MESPQQILDNLNTYTNNFYSALDEYTNSYVNYQLYPQYNETQNIYNNNVANLESLQADVFVATNNVQQNINTLNQLIADLDAKLTAAKATNSDLNAQLTQLLASSNGADILIGESTELYKMQWLSNSTLFVGIFLVLYVLFKVYAPRTQVVPV